MGSLWATWQDAGPFKDVSVWLSLIIVQDLFVAVLCMYACNVRNTSYSTHTSAEYVQSEVGELPVGDLSLFPLFTPPLYPLFDKMLVCWVFTAGMCGIKQALTVHFLRL